MTTSMTPLLEWTIVCEAEELAQQVLFQAKSLPITTHLSTPLGIEDIYTQLVSVASQPCACVLFTPPTAQTLALWARVRSEQNDIFVLSILGNSEQAERSRNIARALGIIVTDQIGPMLSAMVLSSLQLEQPWTASQKLLNRVDKIQLGESLRDPLTRRAGHLVRMDVEHLGFRREKTASSFTIGSPVDVRTAMSALEQANSIHRAHEINAPQIDMAAVQHVIFGPPRALSDPSSKTVLRAYDIPVPSEELCLSPSRAAAEATRIGFPVRVTLASPELRIWDRPEFQVDGVDNAARVRDVFRQMVSLAEQVEPNARILGVSVTQSAPARALLWAHLTPLTLEQVLVTVGFADPHGLASSDQVVAVLPSSAAALADMLMRLRGVSLLVDKKRPTSDVENVVNLINKAGWILLQHPQQIDQIELQPIAVLFDGQLEVREACITVSDAFLKSLSE